MEKYLLMIFTLIKKNLELICHQSIVSEVMITINKYFMMLFFYNTINSLL